MVAPYLQLGDVIVVIVAVALLAPPFGRYLGNVYLNRPTFGDRFLLRVESGVYRLLGVSPRDSMTAPQYLTAVLLTALGLFIWLYAWLTLQGSLPLNPGGIPPMGATLGIHTASSFLTNTDFTHFTYETQVGFGAALLGIQLDMFLSAAMGLSVVAAFIRGFVRKDGTLGNFYVDMVRSLTRVLLPVALLAAVVLVFLGVPETFATSAIVHPLGGGTATIPLGPVATTQAISFLGSNGGSYYSANAAHPFVSPTALALMFETGVMMLIPVSTPFAFAQMVRKRGEGLPYFVTFMSVFLAGFVLYVYAEASSAAVLAGTPLASAPGLSLSGAYPVGSETRFTLPETAVFQVYSVYGNVGANVVTIGSLAPLAQVSLLFGMFTQSTPGGVGTGFGTLLIFAILAVFLGGLMVGRTPEYLGKKITGDQVKWAALALLIHPFLIMIPAAIAEGGHLVTGAGGGTIGLNAHAFTAVLYEFTSEAANNGSALGNLNDNTPFFNLAGAAVMLIGRFLPIAAMLLIAGGFARQDTLPPGPGTMRTRSVTFTVYLTGFVIVISALLFLPVLALGPLAQLGAP